MSRWWGAMVGLLLVGVMLMACGATPVAQTWPGLTVSDNTVYVISGSPQSVIFLDAETGLQKGSFAPQAESRGVPYWSPVTLGGGLAFVGYSDDTAENAGLFAFDPETGQELWYIPAESFVLPAPAYADGTVYFGATDGRVYAVDVETRSVKQGWPFLAEDAIWASPLVADGRVYVASMDHHLYCLDANTGELIWKQQVGGAMAAPPALDTERRMLYVGAFDGRVHALRADSGERVDGFDFRAGNWIWSQPWPDGDRLWVTSLDGKLYALDPSTGAVLPPYPFDSAAIGGKSDALRASPVRFGDSVIVAAESGRVISVNNGQSQWYWPSGNPVNSVLTTPVVADDKVYTVLLNGQVQCLDAQNGSPVWTFSPPEPER